MRASVFPIGIDTVVNIITFTKSGLECGLLHQSDMLLLFPIGIGTVLNNSIEKECG